jgi:hypothetical protein
MRVLVLLLLLIPLVNAQVQLDFAPPAKVQSVSMRIGSLQGSEVVYCDGLVSNGAWPSYAWKINSIAKSATEPVLPIAGLAETDSVECIVTATTDSDSAQKSAVQTLAQIRGMQSPLTGYVIRNISNDSGGINWLPILVFILIGITAINGFLYFRKR